MSSDFQLDRRRVRRQFSQAVAGYGDADVLARATAEQMDARLEGIVLQPGTVLDLGCGPGRDLPLLRQRYPDARLIAVDAAEAMVSAIEISRGWMARLRGRAAGIERLVGDATALPLAPGQVDMVWSNQMLNWLDDPAPALAEIHRIMRVGGMLMFATLGPDCLQELRAALGPHGNTHVHRFIDMHDIGDALVRAGFGDPVMDMDTITLTYPDLDTLVSDLRQSGSTNANAHRPRGLGARTRWQAAREHYDRRRQEGRLPATFEIVYGHAWKPEPRTIDDGREIVRFRPRPGSSR